MADQIPAQRERQSIDDRETWVECPECGGDGGWAMGMDDYWEVCPVCDGEEGWLEERAAGETP